MNKVIIDGLVFSDEKSATYAKTSGKDGEIIDGSYYVQNSLPQDELNVDTLKIKIRYPLEGQPNTKPIEWPYGTECKYYQDNKLFGKYFLENAVRESKYTYELNFQSAIGLLDDTTHYGGIYMGRSFDSILKEILGDKIIFQVDDIFIHTLLSGWLPIASRRQNLQQVLFAVGAVIKLTPQGDLFFTKFGKDVVPTVIEADRTFQGGSIEYNQSMNRVEITEHSYIADYESKIEELFNSKVIGSNFISPEGREIVDGYLITFNEPCFSYESSTEILEQSANYVIVKAQQDKNIVVNGRKHIHLTNVIYREKKGQGESERIAQVKDATLVSAANGSAVGERLLAYYKNQDVLNSSIVSQGEQPTDSVVISNQFGESSTGFIKSVEGNMGASYTRADIDVALDYNPPSPYGVKALTRIDLTSWPHKLVYDTGDYFDPDGMTIVAYYDDGTSNEVYNYTWIPSGPLQPHMKDLTVVYTEAKITHTISFRIDVYTRVKLIQIETPPDKLRYDIGEVFDPTGMVVKAIYSDGSYKYLDSSEYTYTPNGPLSERDGTITISYTDLGVTVEAYQDIIVGTIAPLTAIAVYKKPNKMVYEVDEFFDPSGMEIMAFYEDGYSQIVRGYKYVPNTRLQEDDNRITISYTSSGGTKYTSLDIQVISLSYIYVKTPPTYTDYYEGDDFNPLNMVIAGVFSNGREIIIPPNEYTYAPKNLTTDNKEVVITYTRRERDYTTTQPVNVEYYPYPYTNFIYLPGKEGEELEFDMSSLATHRNIKIVAIGGGEEGYKWEHNNTPYYSDLTPRYGYATVEEVDRKIVINASKGYKIFVDKFEKKEPINSFLDGSLDFKGRVFAVGDQAKELGKPTPPGDGGSGGKIIEKEIVLDRNNKKIKYTLGNWYHANSPTEKADTKLECVVDDHSILSLNTKDGESRPNGIQNAMNGDVLARDGAKGKPGDYAPWIGEDGTMQYDNNSPWMIRKNDPSSLIYIGDAKGKLPKPPLTNMFDLAGFIDYENVFHRDTCAMSGGSWNKPPQLLKSDWVGRWSGIGENNLTAYPGPVNGESNNYIAWGSKGFANYRQKLEIEEYRYYWNNNYPSDPFYYKYTNNFQFDSSDKLPKPKIGCGGAGAHGSGGSMLTPYANLNYHTIWRKGQAEPTVPAIDAKKRLEVVKGGTQTIKYDQSGDGDTGGPGGILIYYS